MSALTSITGLILAGGKSQRMGTDKAFLNFKGQSFIQSSINALKPHCDEIIILGEPSKYKQFNLKVIPDFKTDLGPLSGLYTGLMNSKNDLNIVLSCDIPLVTNSIIEKLINHYKPSQDALVCQVNNRLMPLVGIYHKRTAIVAKLLLDNEQRRMMKLVDQLNASTLPLSDEESELLQNINTPKELKELL